jgi:hypothetical protein
VYLLDPATLGRFLNAQTKVFCLFSCAPPAAAAAMTLNINDSQHNDTHCKHGKSLSYVLSYCLSHFYCCAEYLCAECRVDIVMLHVVMLRVIMLLVILLSVALLLLCCVSWYVYFVHRDNNAHIERANMHSLGITCARLLYVGLTSAEDPKLQCFIFNSK